jgi:hypothetical protein
MIRVRIQRASPIALVVLVIVLGLNWTGRQVHAAGPYPFSTSVGTLNGYWDVDQSGWPQQTGGATAVSPAWVHQLYAAIDMYDWCEGDPLHHIASAWNIESSTTWAHSGWASGYVLTYCGTGGYGAHRALNVGTWLLSATQGAPWEGGSGS